MLRPSRFFYKCFTCIFLLKFHFAPGRECFHNSYFINEETETQKGEGTHPKSLGW